MGFWQTAVPIAATVAGGVGGFFVGGPAGAVAGASTGYAAGRWLTAEDDDVRAPDQGSYSFNYDPAKDPNYALQQQTAGRFLSAAERARLEAEGKLGPSVAEQQLARGQQRAVDDAYQMASSARGGGAAVMLATRHAQRLQAQGQQTAAMDTAQLRAQERQAAEARELQALGGAGQMANAGREQTMDGARAQMEGSMAWDQADRAQQEAERQRAAQREAAVVNAATSLGTAYATSVQNKPKGAGAFMNPDGTYAGDPNRPITDGAGDTSIVKKKP